MIFCKNNFIDSKLDIIKSKGLDKWKKNYKLGIKNIKLKNKWKKL